MKEYRHLTREETDILKNNGCWAENWNNIHVVENFAPEYIIRVNFYGIVRLGSLDSWMPLPGGISVPCGIYDATLFNVSVGDGALITNVHGYIANYDIGARTYIADVGKIYMEGVSSFGNGMEVNVLNETGGRAVAVYDGMSAQAAYFSAMYRHRPVLSEKLKEMARIFSAGQKSHRGSIGSCVKVENVGILRNVRVGDNAVVQGCLRLFDGTVASTAEAPTLMGSGIVCTDFIVQSGAVVEDGAQISRTFVGQGVKLSRGFTCSDCLFFANSHCENGEAVSVFAGPFTVSHHKATLMIGAMFSFMNAGSATNFSNHMYKLGPVHQGVFARGTKCGSGSYMMLPVKVAPFTTVLGHHTSVIDTSLMPFSYVVESEGGSVLVPGANLRSIGLFRDMRKWPERDRRGASNRQDRISYNVFSPYTASDMLAGRALLVGMLSQERISGKPATYGGCSIATSSLTKGAGRYDTVLKYYIGKKIVERLSDRKLNTDNLLRDALTPESTVGEGEWVDIAGMLAPKAEIEKVLDAIESGELIDFISIEKRLSGIFSNYELYEWKWVYDHIYQVYGVHPGTIVRKELVSLLQQWLSEVENLFEDLEKDASKEYSKEAMTGFGVDGGADEALADFVNVRGEAADDAVVRSVRESVEEARQKAADIVSFL